MPNRGGAGKCATCVHPELAQIDANLVAEVPFRQLAKRYGISSRSLQRHKAAHVGREVVALKPGSREVTGTALAEVEELCRGLRAVWDVAEANREVGQMLAVSRELRAASELRAKLSGELNERPQNLTLNLLANDQFMDAIKVMVEILAPYPEARQALIGGLRVLNGDK